MDAKVLSVNLSLERKMNKTPVGKGEIIIGPGLKGDGHARDWHRQASIYSMESLENLNENTRKLLP